MWSKKRLRVEQETKHWNLVTHLVFFRKTVFSVKGYGADTYARKSNPCWNSNSEVVFSENHPKGCVVQQDADRAESNKDVRIEATLFIPRQQTQPNQAVKSCRETALIRLFDTDKRCGSSSFDRIP